MSDCLKGIKRKGPFKLRYNFLALFSAALGALNSLLSIRVLGLSSQNDVLYISSLVILTLTMISAFLTEQFMVFYNEARLESKESAFAFYSTVVTFSFFAQLIIVVLCVLGTPVLLNIFANGLDPARMSMLKIALIIQLIGFVLVPINSINVLVLNSHGAYSLPFFLQIMQLGVNSIVYICMGITKSTNIIPLLVAGVFSSYVIFILQSLAVKRKGLNYFFSLRNKSIKPFLVNSFMMRFGHNINNMLIQPIVSNTLSILPAGNASAYSYSQKFLTLITSVAVGPHQSVLRAEISRKWLEGDVVAIKERIRHFYKTTLLIVIPLCFFVFISVPLVLSVFSGGKIGRTDQLLVQRLFLVGSIWIIQILIESPYVQIAIAAKKSIFFIFENTINLAIIFLALFFLGSRLGLISIPISFIIGQAWNNVANILFSSRLLKAKQCLSNKNNLKLEGL